MTARRVLFVDTASPHPYGVLADGPARVGGAEASLERIATALARADFDVTVKIEAAAGAKVDAESGSRWVGRQVPLRLLARRADTIVIQRRLVDAVRARFASPRSRVVIWYHDWFPDNDTGGARGSRARARVRLIVHWALRIEAAFVSKTHHRNFTSAADLPRLGARVRHHVLHNPLVFPDRAGLPVDPNRLLFCSGAWKGLDQVLQHFSDFRAEMPDLELRVACPGYDGEMTEPQENVTFLGSLAPEDLAREMETSFCIFYPASKVPETFGLIFAEAHAMGTPVLAHDFGAASEFLSAEELIDAEDHTSVRARLVDWYAHGRPVASSHPEFGLGHVLAQWRLVLTGERSL